MKTKYLVAFLAAALLGLGLNGCAELDSKNVAPAVAPAGGIHGEGWNTLKAATFHGTVLKAKSFDLTTCQPCHGGDFTGGTSGVSCFTCHASFPHASGWRNTQSTAFHGDFIASSGWRMQACQSCHGITYAGGISGSACTTCHSSADGPEDCRTCHGNATSIAPPRDLSGDTSATARGVGAHRKHLQGPFSLTATAVACNDCHTVPGNVFAPGHMDSPSPAEVPMASARARIASGGQTPSPAYDAQTGRCGNTFCHGTWQLQRSASPNAFVYTDAVMEGARYAPAWNGGAAEAACGTCHGLPPKGHIAFPLTACIGCHDDVTDANGAILNKAKHMNGKINMSTSFGGEVNFR
jgi:predicted CxxxxCH...CXXCH cytochrome family protein